MLSGLRALQLRLSGVEYKNLLEFALLDLLDAMESLQVLHLANISITKELFNSVVAKKYSYFQYDNYVYNEETKESEYTFVIVSFQSKTLIIADPMMFGITLPSSFDVVHFQVNTIRDIKSIGKAIVASEVIAKSVSIGVRPGCKDTTNFIKEFFINVVKVWMKMETIDELSLCHPGYVMEMTRPPFKIPRYENVKPLRERTKVHLKIHDHSYMQSGMSSSQILKEVNRFYWSVTIASDFSLDGSEFVTMNLELNDGNLEINGRNSELNGRNLEFNGRNLELNDRKKEEALIDSPKKDMLYRTRNIEELQIENPTTFMEFTKIYAEVHSCGFEELVVLKGSVIHATDMKQIPFSVFAELKSPPFIYIQLPANAAENQVFSVPYAYDEVEESMCREVNEEDAHKKGICLRHFGALYPIPEKDEIGYLERQKMDTQFS